MKIPKKWFVEVTKENKDVLNAWRLSQPDVVNKHDHRFGPGCLIISDGYGDKSYFYLSGKESFLMEKGTHEEISYEDFKKYVLKTENMKQISYQQAQNIIDVACESWKRELFTIWGQDIIFKRKIEITEEVYQKMRKACTAPQNVLFDDIFGKDSIPYKVGDWVIGWFCKNEKYTEKAWQIGKISDKYVYPSSNLTHNTDPVHLRFATEEEIAVAKIIPEGVACLVRDTKKSSWRLVYSNGKGKFKGADGFTYAWEYVQVLDVNNIPKY
jgi:hypothetical protein